MAYSKRKKRNRKIASQNQRDSGKITMQETIPGPILPAISSQSSSESQAKVKKKPIVKFKKPQWMHSMNWDRTGSIIGNGILIFCIAWFSFYFLPYQVYPETSFGRSELASSANSQLLAQESARLNEQKTQEDKELYGISQANLKTNFGDLRVTVASETVQTSDNFLRLILRERYNNVGFHRIVEQDTFAAIQGGDFESGDGTGGTGALSVTIPDEIWKVAPEYSESGAFSNTPEFLAPSLYSSLKSLGRDRQGNQQVQVVYPKGVIAMANRGPNTGSSQFFILLRDTVLPPNYTAFARVDPVSLEVLDRISAEVDPSTPPDGRPNKPITLERAELIK